MRKKTNSMITMSFLLLISFIITHSVFAQGRDSISTFDENLPEYGYAHIGLAGNMFEVSSDNMNTAIEPFQVATPIKFGYFLYLTGGFRNIAQVEYRWGKDSNNLFYDETSFPPTMTIDRTTIDMKFDYAQVLFKINPLFFIPDLEALAFFVLWGTGNVDYVDDNGDGFLDGTKKIIGLEISSISKYLQISASFEKNSMVFKKFNIKGFEPINKDFDASTWQVNIKVSAGFGI